MNKLPDSVAEGYLSYLADVERKAKGTINDIRCTLKRLLISMDMIAPGVNVTDAELPDFIKWIELLRKKDYSGETVAKNVSHVRGYLEYALRCGRVNRNVLDGFSVQCGVRKILPVVLSIEEALRLVEVCPSGTQLERRNRAIILILYGCGLRTGELCALKIGDINVERSELIVKKGKGNKQRIVPIPGAVLKGLASYLLGRDKRGRALFKTVAKKKPIRLKDVSEVVKDAARRANITKSVTPKVLRHSYATHLMERGADLSVISMLMGHRSPSETNVYLHSLSTGVRDAVVRLDIKRREKRGRR